MTNFDSAMLLAVSFHFITLRLETIRKHWAESESKIIILMIIWGVWIWGLLLSITRSRPALWVVLLSPWTGMSGWVSYTMWSVVIVVAAVVVAAAAQLFWKPAELNVGPCISLTLILHVRCLTLTSRRSETTRCQSSNWKKTPKQTAWAPLQTVVLQWPGNAQPLCLSADFEPRWWNFCNSLMELGATRMDKTENLNWKVLLQNSSFILYGEKWMSSQKSF